MLKFYIPLVLCFLCSCITTNYLESTNKGYRQSVIEKLGSYGLTNSNTFAVNFKGKMATGTNEDYYLELPLFKVIDGYEKDSITFYYPESSKGTPDVKRVYLLQENELTQEEALTIELNSTTVKKGTIAIQQNWGERYELLSRTGNENFLYDSSEFGTAPIFILQLIAKDRAPNTYNQITLAFEGETWRNLTYLLGLPFTVAADAGLILFQLAFCKVLNMDC